MSSKGDSIERNGLCEMVSFGAGRGDMCLILKRDFGLEGGDLKIAECDTTRDSRACDSSIKLNLFCGDIVFFRRRILRPEGDRLLSIAAV